MYGLLLLLPLLPIGGLKKKKKQINIKNMPIPSNLEKKGLKIVL